ncbi:MAG TPA: uracil phosphoribosyltransferase [Chryseosolibacter sp.]|nr:uracil phosphoribosyltransferase [Chryseosolibacter sp.]
MIFVLSDGNSVANNYLLELRDRDIQKDPMRFRKNVERLGEIMAYEVSKKLRYVQTAIETPLGRAKSATLAEQPVLVTILRAGLPYFNGFLNFFDKAESGFIGAYRQESGQGITINLEYLATTSLSGKTIILIDPMLATGRSVINALRAMKRNGEPMHVHIVSLVAAPEGVAYLNEKMNLPYSLWTCAVDEKLDENYYIVPGLGDAGDLSFGNKI